MKKHLFFLTLIIFASSCSSDSFPSKIYTGSIRLCSQQEIDDFGKNNYTVITGNIEIGCNDSNSSNITNLNALISVRKTKGIYLLYNDLLANINGLSNIDSLGTLSIHNCDAIANLDVFTNLTKLDNIMLDYNNRLKNINGINNSKKLEYVIITANEGLLNIDGLKNVIKFNSIRITGNNSLTSVNGLSKATSVLYGLEIIDNSKLTDFCALTNLIRDKGLSSGGYSVSGNGYNPTEQNIATGKCRK